MREFFRGWKRKIGIVTLVMACVFAIGWIRSTPLMDDVVIHLGSSTIIVQSMDQSLCCLTGFENTHLRNGTHFTKWQTHKWRSVHAAFHPTSPPHPDFEWGNCGFYVFGATNPLNQWITARVVPYWSITIPLTLLSAFLLLSKPRKSTSTNVPELTVEEGATL